MRVNFNDYSGSLIVLAAGAFGFSLFCIVSALAMNGVQTSASTPINIKPQSLLDSAVSNINTVAALTVAAIPQYLTTPSVTPTITLTTTATNTSSPTSTRIPIQPTRTRVSNPVFTNTFTPFPTQTFSPVPTDTPIPSPTHTLMPTFTDTPTDIPPETPVPTDTPTDEPTENPTETPSVEPTP